MRRSWVIVRSDEGDESAQAHAAVLAVTADAEFIRAVGQAKALLDAGGGKVFIGAKRVNLDAGGEIVALGQPGQVETVAYVIEWDSQPVRGEPVEPDRGFTDAEATIAASLEPVAAAA